MHRITDRERRHHGCEYCAHIKKWSRDCPFNKCPYAHILDQHKDYYEYCKEAERIWMELVGRKPYAKRGLLHSRARNVRCVETGEVFGSVVEAAERYGLRPYNIYDVCNGLARSTGKMHFEYCDL